MEANEQNIIAKEPNKEKYSWDFFLRMLFGPQIENLSNFFLLLKKVEIRVQKIEKN